MKGVRNVLKVLFQIKPPKKETQRPAFHICVVLDKSASMEEENRLRNCKRVTNKPSLYVLPQKQIQIYIIKKTAKKQKKQNLV